MGSADEVDRNRRRGDERSRSQKETHVEDRQAQRDGVNEPLDERAWSARNGVHVRTYIL